MLTTRQEQVSACAARGLCNKEIGRELGITERTVKVHLTTIYRRLGISGRTQGKRITIIRRAWEDANGTTQ